jgi:hypothetical protein
MGYDYIRITMKSLLPFLTKKHQPEELFKALFDAEPLGADGIQMESLFAVANSAEEILTPALHHLTGTAGFLKDPWLMRIDRKDLEAVGIKFEKRSDETGIAFLDDRHVHIEGPRDRFVDLASHLREKTLFGEDRIRKTSQDQMAVQIRKFLEANAGGMLEEKRRRGWSILNNYDGTGKGAAAERQPYKKRPNVPHAGERAQQPESVQAATDGDPPKPPSPDEDSPDGESPQRVRTDVPG